MLNALKPQAEDKIVRMMAMFRDDPRRDKIDLGVGVYKDASGLTPIMRAVKTAEQQLWMAETTKTYTALAGDPGFHAVMTDLILGDAVPHDRVAAAATTGGTGAVHHALELIRMASPLARVWVSNPTWPNHLSIIDHIGVAQSNYRYFDSDSCAVDFAAMMADLEQVRGGDVVLLHGCCHNPTGANLTLPEWQAVADLLQRKGAVPLIDLAYQGFGDGLAEDSAATRLLSAQLPELMIAASCSKNFGIYRERTGILITISPDTATSRLAQGALAHLNRQNFSFPPDHGARLVTMVLSDPALRTDWQAELEAVRLSMIKLRMALADALRAETGSDRFGFIAQHRGMFSRLGLDEAAVETLRQDHAIYMIGDSRMNIAGLNAATVPVVAAAVARVLGR